MRQATSVLLSCRPDWRGRATLDSGTRQTVHHLHVDDGQRARRCRRRARRDHDAARRSSVPGVEACSPSASIVTSTLEVVPQVHRRRVYVVTAALATSRVLVGAETEKVGWRIRPWAVGEPSPARRGIGSTKCTPFGGADVERARIACVPAQLRANSRSARPTARSPTLPAVLLPPARSSAGKPSAGVLRSARPASSEADEEEPMLPVGRPRTLPHPPTTNPGAGCSSAFSQFGDRRPGSWRESSRLAMTPSSANCLLTLLVIHRRPLRGRRRHGR